MKKISTYPQHGERENKEKISYLSIKKIFFVLLIFIFTPFNTFAEIEDDSIIKELNKENTEEISAENLQFKKFNSCEDLEKVIGDYIKSYNLNYSTYRGFSKGMIGIKEDMVLDDFSTVESITKKAPSVKSSVTSNDFSKTNEQVVGVSESEIVKTDGNYIYYMSDYYNESEKSYKNRWEQNVFIIDVKTKEVIKKIKLPEHFRGTKLYLQNNKLIIVATGNPTGSFQKKYWNNDSKTYSIIYNVRYPEKAKLIKVFATEGSFSKSRLIGNKLYIISEKNNYNLFRGYSEDNTIKVDDVIPKGMEIITTNNNEEKNVEINGQKKDYKVIAGDVLKCDEIEYILPENDTDLGYPQFNLISIIDINNVNKLANTKVIFGNLSEIYMSLDNLYVTNRVYKSKPFRCPTNLFCISPYYYGGTNHTLIHKMSIKADNLDYKTSTLVEGSPLTQYSMDEYKGDFRILTKTNRWNSNLRESHTDLYVLDENLKLKSSLQNLGAGEDFKSSRYIGDKLFLVTFQQIDPLFAIDLSDPKNPKILGELKIPGYSTYLHPYENDTHLIGLGYNTSQNQRGGVYNDGLKVDLYKIFYDKKCGDTDLTVEEEEKCKSGDYKGIIVKQLHSLTLGEYGSTSEALSNPRTFVWNKQKNTLLLPATTYINDKENHYKHKDFFQGLYSINIDKTSGIKKNYTITHINTDEIDKKRIEECFKYAEDTKETCKKIIGGGEYCKPVNVYVPEYCYSDSTIGEYISSKKRTFKKDFIERAIWIGDNVYTLSDSKLTISDFDTGREEDIIDLQ